MKNSLILSTVAIAALYAVLSSGVASSLLLFSVAGSVPGTDLVAPPEYMVGLYATTIAVLFARGLVVAIKRLRSYLKKPVRTKLPARRRYVRKPSVQ